MCKMSISNAKINDNLNIIKSPVFKDVGQNLYDRYSAPIIGM